MGHPDPPAAVVRVLAVVRSDAVVALSAAARDAIWRWFGVESRIVSERGGSAA